MRREMRNIGLNPENVNPYVCGPGESNPQVSLSVK